MAKKKMTEEEKRIQEELAIKFAELERQEAREKAEELARKQRLLIEKGLRNPIWWAEGGYKSLDNLDDDETG
jgi:hypothetical protein